MRAKTALVALLAALAAVPAAAQDTYPDKAVLELFKDTAAFRIEDRSIISFRSQSLKDALSLPFGWRNRPASSSFAQLQDASARAATRK